MTARRSGLKGHSHLSTSLQSQTKAQVRDAAGERRSGLKGHSHLSTSPEMAGGSCLCGEVAFELVRSAGQVMSCQCATCRRGQGTAHTANVFVDSAKFRWLRGESQVSNYGPPKDWHFGTAFCRQCGSTVPRVVRSVGIVVVPTGTLDARSAARAETNPHSEWLPPKPDDRCQFV